MGRATPQREVADFPSQKRDSTWVVRRRKEKSQTSLR